MEPVVGIEPTVYRLQGQSTTTIKLPTSAYAEQAVGRLHHLDPAAQVLCHEWCHATRDARGPDGFHPVV